MTGGVPGYPPRRVKISRRRVMSALEKKKDPMKMVAATGIESDARLQACAARIGHSSANGCNTNHKADAHQRCRRCRPMSRAGWCQKKTLG